MCSSMSFKPYKRQSLLPDWVNIPHLVWEIAMVRERQKHTRTTVLDKNPTANVLRRAAKIRKAEAYRKTCGWKGWSKLKGNENRSLRTEGQRKKETRRKLWKPEDGEPELKGGHNREGHEEKSNDVYIAIEIRFLADLEFRKTFDINCATAVRT